MHDFEKLIVVVAHLRALPGKEDALRARLHTLMEEVSGHEGMLLNSIHQSRTDPRNFVFYEQFASEEAIKAHGATPELERWRAEKPLYVESGQYDTWQMINRVGSTIRK